MVTTSPVSFATWTRHKHAPAESSRSVDDPSSLDDAYETPKKNAAARQDAFLSELKPPLFSFNYNGGLTVYYLSHSQINQNNEGLHLLYFG